MIKGDLIMIEKIKKKYKIEKISYETYIIQTDEWFQNGDGIDIYLTKKNKDFFLFSEDIFFEIFIKKGDLNYKEKQKINNISSSNGINFIEEEEILKIKVDEENILKKIKKMIEVIKKLENIFLKER